METTKLKRFAQFARRSLIEQISEKLKLVLAADSLPRREQAEAVTKLEEQIAANGKAAVIEAAAYTWFNRFCALRFMDVNRYTRVGIVSPQPGQFQPEILANAKQGDIDPDIVNRDALRAKIAGLLSGKESSADPQAEAYRLLVVAACNYWHKAMPFLFEKIQDYTELLMPEDLLSGKSILSYTREALTPAACEDVEAIGWLYQFYISEKKDQVFEGLKKNKKITPENIPAATQLFTPHWIVRYLVENSLGRLWMLNRPDSRLFKDMQKRGEDCYYIEPTEPETDFLKINSPEEIRICDPACGSGHMLTYAFDLLYRIYQEAGYDEADIPAKILTHNLYGVEIDERAGELAAFALTMKAAEKLKGSKQRRFFRQAITPNICVVENVIFEPGELKEYMDYVGRDLFTEPLQTTLRQFEEADNFGSLIRPELTDVAGIRSILEGQDFSSDWIYKAAHEKALKALEQADYLSPKYHVVVANPPYMGSNGMNQRMSTWLSENFPDARSDLFSAFVERNTFLTLPKGQLGFMTPYVWMFISSYQKLRHFLINKKTITSLIQLEYSGFDGATVPICTFTIENNHQPNFLGGYVRLSSFRGAGNQGPRALEAIANPECGWFYRAASADFKKVPGSPIAYWLSQALRDVFTTFPSITNYAAPKKGMMTGDNGRFLRLHWEVSRDEIFWNCSSHEQSAKSDLKWYPHNKGGEFRKWYGNEEFLINFQRDGEELKAFEKYGERNPDLYFKEGLSWTKITSSHFSSRHSSKGHLYDDASCVCAVHEVDHIPNILGILNSNVGRHIINSVSQTLNFSPGEISKLPIAPVNVGKLCVGKMIEKSKSDWDSYETSWNFKRLPLIASNQGAVSLQKQYQTLRTNWKEMFLKMHRLEEENNRIFIEAYGLEGELTPEVPLKEITLTCNPHYRYGGNKSEAELEALLLADTMREFISYAVGCMFGRFALEKPGLILANQGETLADYLKQIPEPSFPADDDNVIPILDGEWFTDDISERFKTFLKLTFGEEHYEANLAFIENALGKKGKPLKIRDYFLKEFYTDHVKRYKKRPIYWLFASPKGSFKALIYMHRYRPETASIVLNDYLREFRTKLSARLDNEQALAADASASKADKNKALKQIDQLKKMLTELEDWERDVLFPLASKKIEIDLDHGVKHNYPLFGEALKKIPGLS